MKRHFISPVLLSILVSCLSISAMQERKLTRKEYPAPLKETNETIIAIKKKKKNGKKLTFLHTTNTITQEQSWTGYLKNYLYSAYIAYYKFDPETARRKWRKFNVHYYQNALNID